MNITNEQIEQIKEVIQKHKKEKRKRIIAERELELLRQRLQELENENKELRVRLKRVEMSAGDPLRASQEVVISNVVSLPYSVSEQELIELSQLKEQNDE